MTTTEHGTQSNNAVVLVYSDAPTNEHAIREINQWASENGYVRSGEYQLNVRQSTDGRRLFYGACYQLTDEDRRAAADDLHRIRARRQAMPISAPSDQLSDEED